MSCQSGSGDVLRLDNSCCWWRWTRNVPAGSTIGSDGGVDGQRNARWRSTPNESSAHGAVRRWEDDGRCCCPERRSRLTGVVVVEGGRDEKRGDRRPPLSLCFESGGTQVGRGGYLRVRELALLLGAGATSGLVCVKPRLARSPLAGSPSLKRSRCKARRRRLSHRALPSSQTDRCRKALCTSRPHHPNARDPDAVRCTPPELLLLRSAGRQSLSNEAVRILPEEHRSVLLCHAQRRQLLESKGPILCQHRAPSSAASATRRGKSLNRGLQSRSLGVGRHYSIRHAATDTQEPVLGPKKRESDQTGKGIASGSPRVPLYFLAVESFSTTIYLLSHATCHASPVTWSGVISPTTPSCCVLLPGTTSLAFPSFWQLWAVAEQPRHHRWRIPRAFRSAYALNRLPDLGLLFLTQVHIDSIRILLEVFDPLRPRNRDKVIATTSVSTLPVFSTTLQSHPCARTQANASWPGVHPFFCAISASTPTNFKLSSKCSSLNLG